MIVRRAVIRSSPIRSSAAWRYSVWTNSMCSSVTLTSPAATSSPVSPCVVRAVDAPRTARPGSGRRSPPTIRGAPLRRPRARRPGLRSAGGRRRRLASAGPPIRGSADSRPVLHAPPGTDEQGVAAGAVDDVVQLGRPGPATAQRADELADADVRERAERQPANDRLPDDSSAAPPRPGDRRPPVAPRWPGGAEPDRREIRPRTRVAASAAHSPDQPIACRRAR